MTSDILLHMRGRMKSRHFLKCAGVAVFHCLSVAPASQAVEMLNNLNENTVGASFVGYADFFDPNPPVVIWAGSRFVTDNSASSFQLESVTLSMAAGSDDSGGFSVAIYEDVGSAPGAVPLEILDGDDNPFAAGEYTYTSLLGLLLAPNTSYWVVARGVEDGGLYGWNVQDAEVEPPPFPFTGPWTIPDTATHITSFNLEGGDNWNSATDGYPRQFSIDATAVPEPSYLAVLAVLGGMAICARRKAARRVVS